MLILGIDPGTATTGYGVISFKNQSFELIDFGLIETNKDGSPEKRLLDIYKQTVKIFKKFKPDIMAIEKLFFATNAKTAMRVGQAHGVMLFTAARTKTPVAEYAPGTIKKVVAGDGKANKEVIQKYVRKFLGAKVRKRKGQKTHFDNAADALAVAICHAKSKKGGEKGG